MGKVKINAKTLLEGYDEKTGVSYNSEIDKNFENSQDNMYNEIKNLLSDRIINTNVIEVTLDESSDLYEVMFDWRNKDSRCEYKLYLNRENYVVEGMKLETTVKDVEDATLGAVDMIVRLFKDNTVRESVTNIFMKNMNK